MTFNVRLLNMRVWHRHSVLLCQWFAPTTLVVSFEKEGPGRFTDDEIEEMVQKDAKGKVVALHLPQKMVLIANHQVCSREGG